MKTRTIIINGIPFKVADTAENRKLEQENRDRIRKDWNRNRLID